MVSLQHLPAKLNPVIRPIMEALKREENAQLQVGLNCHITSRGQDPSGLKRVVLLQIDPNKLTLKKKIFHPSNS